jgi:hypothetical protein
LIAAWRNNILHPLDGPLPTHLIKGTINKLPMKQKQLVNVFLFSIITLGCSAQDSSLLKMLNDSMAVHEKPFYTTGTFKAMYIVNMQTIEAPAAGALNVEIQHRFGQINSGIYDFFGLDNASWRLGLDYGITNDLAIGVGRSSYEKTYDGYIKWKFIKQTEGDKMPITVSILGTISNYTLEQTDKPYLDAAYRTGYTTQLLIARKFSRNLSIELAPTYIHLNLVPTAQDQNDMFALCSGLRFKFNKRMSINAEYDWLPTGQMPSQPLQNSFSLGWDIETGGHVFQLVFSNSQGMIPTQYITQTTGKWTEGDIYFGFNISRNFNLTKKAKGNAAKQSQISTK